MTAIGAPHVVDMAHREPSRLTQALARPETDREATLLSGLGLVAAGFLLAQIIGSILFVPLSLLVPGSVLTLIGLTARQPVEEPE